MSAQTIYEVVSKKLDVQSQPNADAQVIGQKKEHDLVEVYSIIDGWACIKYEKVTGFVDQYCIKPLDDTDTEAQSTPPVTENRQGSNDPKVISQGESEYKRSWSGATHYTKYMINGEGAFFYRGLYYIVLSDKRRTVAVVKPQKVKYKDNSYVIPSSVSTGNVTYTVTEIAPSAFSDNSNLTNITLPETLEAINSFAFQGCI